MRRHHGVVINDDDKEDTGERDKIDATSQDGLGSADEHSGRNTVPEVRYARDGALEAPGANATQSRAAPQPMQHIAMQPMQQSSQEGPVGGVKLNPLAVRLSCQDHDLVSKCEDVRVLARSLIGSSRTIAIALVTPKYASREKHNPASSPVLGGAGQLT